MAGRWHRLGEFGRAPWSAYSEAAPDSALGLARVADDTCVDDVGSIFLSCRCYHQPNQPNRMAATLAQCQKGLDDHRARFSLAAWWSYMAQDFVHDAAPQLPGDIDSCGYGLPPALGPIANGASRRRRLITAVSRAAAGRFFVRCSRAPSGQRQRSSRRPQHARYTKFLPQ